MTVVVCLICAVVFLKQQSDWKDFNHAIDRYCQQDRSHIKRMVFDRIAELNRYEHCAEMMYTVTTDGNGEEIIEEIILGLRPLAGFSREDSKVYVRKMLQDEWRAFDAIVPDNPDHAFAYYTGSWNPLAMITSSFAHGDWAHIIFNLLFFVAFAATVEALAGPLMFVVSIVAISWMTGIFSSVSAYATGVQYWTLGLSGVVMGMMGLFSCLLPRGRVKCFYWFIILFGTVAIPAWALTLWYVGGDIVRLFASDDHGFVNVMAHVTGGFAGYLFGLAFLRRARARAKDLMFELDMNGR
jgi:membrane associated rhomboid family serine protease